MKTVWRQNLVMLSLSQLLVMAGYDAMMPFIPLFMKSGLGLGEGTGLALYVSLFNIMGYIGYGVANPVWGLLGDRYGMKVMLLRGTFLTALFWPMMAYVDSPVTLVAIRFVTAFLAGTTAASQMMIARTAPLERQGFSLGLLNSVIFAGSMLGNLLGGLIIHYYDYQIAFWLCGGMYFLAGIFIIFTADSGIAARSEAGRSGRSAGSAIRLPRIVWLLIGLFVLGGLIRRTDMPFVALRVESLTTSVSADYWTGIASFIVGIGAILSGVVTGRLVDRIPAERLILPVMAGTGVFTLLQGMGHSLPCFIGARTACYFVAGAIFPLLQKLLVSKTPHDQRGLAFGVSTTATAIGGIIAAAIGGAVMSRWGVAAVFIAGGLFAFIFISAFRRVVRRASK